MGESRTSAEYYREKYWMIRYRGRLRGEVLKLKHSSCGKKVRHESQEAAEAVINQLPYGPMCCYQCVFCFHWHIGHDRKDRTARWRYRLRRHFRERLILNLRFILLQKMRES